MGEVRQLAPEERITFQQAAERYIHHVEHVMLRKASTVKDYRIITTKHLGPHFHTKTLEKITPDDVVAYIAAKRHAGLAVKTITNHLNSGWVSQPRQVRARIVSRGANSSPRPQASVGSWRSLVETRAYHAERDGLTPSSTPVSALPLKCNSNATLASFRAETPTDTIAPAAPGRATKWSKRSTVRVRRQRAPGFGRPNKRYAIVHLSGVVRSQKRR
jgi:hypothetical protein